MILILGTPGAGKTTETRLLAEYLHCPGFSMGELIRQKAAGKDRREMLAGKIISDESTIKIVDDALKSHDLNKQECVFEGNPRSVPQAKWWVEQVNSGRMKIRGVIHLVVDPSIARQRLAKRERFDDQNKSVLKERFAEYHRSIKPTLDYLTSHGLAVHEIDSNGTIDEVADQIHQTLGV